MADGKAVLETTALVVLTLAAGSVVTYLLKVFFPGQQKSVDARMDRATGFAEEIARTTLDGMRSGVEAMHKMALTIDELRGEDRERHKEVLEALGNTRNEALEGFKRLETKLGVKRSTRRTNDPN